MSEMYTVKEVANLLSLQERTIRKYIAEGKLKAVKVLGNVRVTQDELDRIIEPVSKSK